MPSDVDINPVCVDVPREVGIGSTGENKPAARPRLEEKRKWQRKNRTGKKRKKAAARLEEQTGAGHSNPVSTFKSVTIYRKRRPDPREGMMNKAFAHDDDIFKEFKRSGGKGSGTIYVLDEATKELVFAVKITETKDMADEDKTT